MPSNPLIALNRLIRRFVRTERGVAAVEFALVMPVLITLYFGTVEAASLYSVDRRVSTVANTIGDLVSRTDGPLTNTTLNDYFQAANGVMEPYASTGLKQVVSLLAVTSAGVATVKWSKACNGGTARTANSSFPLAATTQINKLAQAAGWLVASEVSYPYKPVYGMVISKTINLAHTEYYLPRYDDEITMSGTVACTT